MLNLRPYQEKGIQQLRIEFQKHNRIICWLPTGGGKTAMFCYITNQATKNGKKILIVMRRRELIFQTTKKLKDYYGLNCNIVMGADSHDINSNITVGSIDTLIKREIDFKPDFIIVDEVHDTTSDKYEGFLTKYNCKWIGFTATPFRTGNRGLELWDSVISPITMKELIEQKYLSPYKIYAPKQIDVSQVNKVGGDFNQSKLSQQASKITGDIVNTWKKYASDMPTVLFGVNKDHSRLMARAFQNAGIPAEHQDCENNSASRELAIRKLEKGIIKVLCNVNIFSTGVDIPAIECLILARPTHSLNLHLQQIGRGLRTNPGKTNCLVLDHAGNVFRHGFPDDDRSPQLSSLKKGSRLTMPQVLINTCKACLAVFPSGISVCPYCGHESPIKPKEILTEAGELELLQKDTLMQSYVLKQIKKDLDYYHRLTLQHGWKPNARYFKIHERYGNKIFMFEKELGLPTWLKGIIQKNTPT